MFWNKEHKGGFCQCCDGKDEKCRCPHHWLPLLFVKALIGFVVLVFVFALGVWVGKVSMYWKWSYGGAYYGMGPWMMRQGYPTMQWQGQPYYPQQQLQR